jgi:bifunctional non-homologous end joining protein LigD
MSGQQLRVGRVTVNVSNVDKLLFPDDGITKGDLIDYHHEVAAAMLPHLKGRPLALQRYPDGLAGGGFFQQQASGHFPDWVDRATVPLRGGGQIDHVVCNTPATLVYLANQGCITLHTWLSHADRPERPDQLIFDLDPPGEQFAEVRWTAHMLRSLLDELGLPSLVKTTGGRGLHVHVPIARRQEFDSVREFAREVADTLAEREPRRITTETRKAKRHGRLYLDTARNAYGQTAVAPYTVRARPGAPVATPLDWSELDDRRFDPKRFTLRTVPRRSPEDPWQDVPGRASSLTDARRRLHSLRRAAA